MSFFGKKRKKFMQEFFNDAFDVFEGVGERFEKIVEMANEKETDEAQEKKNEADRDV